MDFLPSKRRVLRVAAVFVHVLFVAAIAGADEDAAAFHQQFIQRASLPPNTPQAFSQWQQTYRNNVAGWLMGGGLPAQVPLDVQVISVSYYPTFTLERVQYNSLSDRTNQLLISLPKGVAKAPVLLALHGHEGVWGQADDSAYTLGNADDFCAYFAQRGWAVVQPATLGQTLQYPSWSLTGQWTWDSMRALDYAATVPQVDMNRVGVVGLSTGGWIASDVLALDSRVKAGVAAGSLTTWYHMLQSVPGGGDLDGLLTTPQFGATGNKLECADWAALAAPKPVQFQQGIQDPVYCPGADPSLMVPGYETAVIPTSEYNEMFAEVQRAYTLAGNPDGAVSSDQ